ncbi:hypothetical protein SLA2020_020360 [Shorea laevis]
MQTAARNPRQNLNVLEGSVSFKGRELERLHSTKSTSSDKENNEPIEAVSPNCTVIDAQSPRSDGSEGTIQQLPILDVSNPKHEAAIKQEFSNKKKVSRLCSSYSAELRNMKLLFRVGQEQEPELPRWERVYQRMVKLRSLPCSIGLRGLTHDIDLDIIYTSIYYDKWLNSQSKEPFFYWLDIGEGKEVNLEACPRSKLQQQCIKYHGPMERIASEVIVVDGKFLFKQTGKLLQTTGNAKWIFVLSTSKTLYVGQKKKGAFQHSSFLAGGATIASGRLVVEGGVLEAVWPQSSHHRTTPENFKDFISFLEKYNVHLTDVKMRAADEEEGSIAKQHTSEMQLI